MLLFLLEGGGRTTGLHDNSCISNSSGLINYVMSSKRANKRTATKATAAAAGKKSSHNQQQNRLKEVSRGQSEDELKPEDHRFSFLHPLPEHHDEFSAASSSRADEDFGESELLEKELLESMPEPSDELDKCFTDPDDVDVELRLLELTSIPFYAGDGFAASGDDLPSPDSLDNTEALSASNESSKGDALLSSPSLPSPGKKWPKKGRSERKGGGKNFPDKVLVDEVSSEVSQSSDTGPMTDSLSAKNHVLGLDYGVAHDRTMENHVALGLEKSRDEPSSADAARHGKLKSEVLAEESATKDQDGRPSVTALQSTGRGSDPSEEAGTKSDRLGWEYSANSTAAKINVLNEQDAKGKTEQSPVDGSSRIEAGVGERSSNFKAHEIESQNSQGDGVQSGDTIASGRGTHKENEIGGKGQQGFEGSRARDERADTWSNRKEQDVRGKTQLGTSQASRESSWRRRPMESRVGQESPRGGYKSGLEVDSKKDEQQDFRSRAQHGAEPQATHKNWIPRRGLQREGEMRADQKARGKGKQGREAGSQTQPVKDIVRLKFEADLRIKQEELLQKSKQSLKAEFQKIKQIEQAKRGREELEMELNRNLVYEEGELFYLNS